MSYQHIPIMVDEIYAHLDLASAVEGDVYIDGTCGLGGHIIAFCQKNPHLRVIAFERDAATREMANARFAEHGIADRVTVLHQRFSHIGEYLAQNPMRVHSVLFDLGISSMQLDDAKYGISFQALDEPLDMRLDPWCQTDAAEILNTWSHKSLSDLFFYYADYRFSRQLASKIMEKRPLRTVGDLVTLCEQYRAGNRINPATLPFMALRIYINGELSEIQKALESLEILHQQEQHAKIAVLTFHSGEDRLVKNLFKSQGYFDVITKKPLIPSAGEIRKNPRSRSAKLRIASIK